MKKRVIYIAADLQPGTVSLLGREVRPQLLPGQVGVMFAYESQAACEAQGHAVLITAEVNDARPAPRRKAGGKAK